MPKIIVTSRYIKPNAHKRFGNYIRYIATREHYGMSYQEAMLELLGGGRAAELEIVPQKNEPQNICKKEFNTINQLKMGKMVFNWLIVLRV